MLVGTRATIPPKMINDRPLPTPCSVIISPNHTPNIVPAVMVNRIVIVESTLPPLKPKLGRIFACADSACARPNEYNSASGTVRKKVH
ncbi:MAG: hypothetical protein BWY25_00024 [Chloroflexi bacterium ADurb.Bin222]|nr:MAG: hypothetical protein BWY25_00024 [Chloroflexi bacterium ADurb.Bin222]